MLQPLQIPDSLLFLGFSVLMIAIFIPTFIWALRKVIGNMKKSTEFTNLEMAAVRRQMLALLVGVPLILLFFALAPLIWDQPTSDMIFLSLLIGFVPLAYIAVSAIRNRVSIGGALPVKGAKAVRSGVISLVFLILMFGGFAIYFALYFASLK